jgi:RHS repeat-associated protein
LATDSSWWSYPVATQSTTTYAANGLNEYTTVGLASPTYDGNGNLLTDGTYSYCYDAESRLTGIISAGTCTSPTTTVATYAYDAQGRRKSKTVGSVTTAYVTDADNREVLEYNGTSGGGALLRWYSFGRGPDAVLNQMNAAGTTRATLIPDIQGSLIGSLDAASGTLTKTGYQPFGENSALTTSANPGFYYTGRRLDPETAGSASQPSGIYYDRSRMYLPDWGRFLQPDSIGYAAGTNLYAYVNNDPLNLTDPFGLCDSENGCEANFEYQPPPSDSVQVSELPPVSNVPSSSSINAYLASKSSPLASQGENFMQYGQQYNIDPRLMVAISGAETSFGTNITAGANNVFNNNYNGMNSPFNSFQSAISSEAKMLSRPAYNLSSTSTLYARYCSGPGCSTGDYILDTSRPNP